MYKSIVSMPVPSRSRSLRGPQKQVVYYTRCACNKWSCVVLLTCEAKTTEIPRSTHRPAASTASAIPERAKITAGTKSLLPQRRTSNLREASSKPRPRPPVERRQPSPSKEPEPSKSPPLVRSPEKTSLPLPRVDWSAPLVRPPSTSVGTGLKKASHSRHQSQTQVSRGQTTTGLNARQGELPPPNKATKIPPVTSSDSKPPLISSSWPEVTALQTELLQLHLFHSSYLHRNLEWQTNAETNLRQKYDHLAQAYRATLAEEKETQRQANYHALAAWIDASHRDRGWDGSSDQIQTLSSVVQDVSDISAGSKYGQLVGIFEDWIQEADTIRRERRNDHSRTKIKNISSFIDPLPPSWKNDVSLLATKLELCVRRLQSLDILQSGETAILNSNASLVRILLGFGEIITLMVEELSVMGTLESDLVRSERAWVNRCTEELVSSPPDLSEDRVGIWRQERASSAKRL